MFKWQIDYTVIGGKKDENSNDIVRNLPVSPVSSCPNVDRVDHFANSLVFCTFVCLSLTPQTLLAVNISSCWILLRVANSALLTKRPLRILKITMLTTLQWWSTSVEEDGIQWREVEGGLVAPSLHF